MRKINKYDQNTVPKMMEKSIKSAAKKYLKYGFSILPSSPTAKHPMIAWKAHQKELISKNYLVELFDLRPDSDIACVTGKLSGIAVVDADNKKAIKWCDKHLPKTPVTQTTKHGKHYFYKYVKGVRNKTDYFKEKEAGGRIIDVRGRSGIIMLAPTPNYVMHGSLTARDLPDFPLDLLPSLKRRKKSTRTQTQSREIDDPEVLSAMEAIDPAITYLSWFEIAAGLKAEFGDRSFDLFFNWSIKSENPDHDWSESQFEDWWESVNNNNNFSIKTIFHYAYEAGWKWNGSKLEDNDFVDHSQSLRAYSKKTIEKDKYIMEQLIKPQTIGMIYSGTGIGKTALGLHIALCCATGVPFLNWSVKKAVNTLYVDGEMAEPELREYTDNACKFMNVKMKDREKMFLLTSKSMEELKGGGSLNLALEKDRKYIDWLVEKKEIEVLFLDNLSSLIEGSDMDEDIWIPFNKWLRTLRHKNIAVIVFHHAGASGNQRGLTKKIDIVNFSICLKKDIEYNEEKYAVAYSMNFEKGRGLPTKAKKPVAIWVEQKGGIYKWKHEYMKDTKKKIVIRLLEEEKGEVAIKTLMQESGCSRTFANRTKREFNKKRAFSPSQGVA